VWLATSKNEIRLSDSSDLFPYVWDWIEQPNKSIFVACTQAGASMNASEFPPGGVKLLGGSCRVFAFRLVADTCSLGSVEKWRSLLVVKISKLK